MSVSNYKVHKLWVKEAEFEVLVLEIPEVEIEDKLAYFARDKGNINRSFYEDFVIATCVANINQLLFHIKQQALLQPNLMNIRLEIMNGILEINPLFKPDNLVINRNSVVKLKGKKGPKDGERLLADNKSWNLSYYEEVMKNQPQIDGEGVNATPAVPSTEHESPKKPAAAKPLNELEYVIVKKWWKRINRYVEIKQFKEEDMGSILKQRFFHNRSSFQTFIVSVCVIDSDDLLTLLDNMGIPSRVAPPILMHEIYELCREDNKFLTYENAQKFTEGLENDENDSQQSDVNRSTPNRMASHARQQNTKKKKPKKVFKDVPKEDLLKLGDNMKVFLIGQDQAINDIAEAVQRASVGLKDPVRPIGSFLFAGRTGIGKCTEKGTLIFSEDGIKPIDSFCGGDKISELSMDVYGINGVNRTSHIYKEGIKPGRRIVTDSGYELGGSLIHPVVSLNGSGYPEFKRFFDLTTDDYVAIQYNQNYFSATNKKTNFDFVKRVHDSRSIIHKLPEEINEDLAYYIGLLIGDGGLTIDGMLSFTNKDKQLVRKFFELSKSLFGVIPKYTSGKYGYAIYSTQIYNFLKDGCGITMCKSTHKEIPSIILESTKECIKSFIVGLMDTDGYFEKQGGIVGITLTTKNLVKQLQTVLLNFGIISSVRHKLVRYNGGFNNAWELTIRGKYAKRFFVKIGFSLNSKKDKYNLIYLKNDNPNKDVIPNIHNIIYDLVSAYRLNRKFHRNYRGYYKGYKKPSRKKLIEILNVMHSLVGKEIESNNSYLYLCSLSLKEIFWSKIARIDYVDEMDLYDFTVPETHTFTSNGFISHNTLAAKVLADELIRDRDNLITIDCSEYSADHEYAKLIGCFVPGTKVLMEDGSRKKIENINVGDKVITHKGRSRKVEFVHKYEQNGDMVEITTTNSNIPETTTKTHEILTIKSDRCTRIHRKHVVCKPTCSSKDCTTKLFNNYELGWTAAKDLKAGDIVAYPRYKSTGEYPEFVDLASYVDEFTNYKYDDNFVWAQEHVKVPRYIKVNEDFMRLAGYYVSEGGSSGKAKSINFTFHSKEHNYIIETTKLIRKMFGNDVRIRIKDRSPSLSYRIYVSSKIICAMMSDLFGHNTYVKKVPSWFKDVPDNLLKGFLETAVFGDGCQVTPRRMDYSTVSETLHSQMELFFRRLGYITATSLERKSKIDPNCKDRYRLYISGSQIEKLNTEFNFDIDLSDMKLTNIQRMVWIDDDYVYRQIKKIDAVNYTGKVYDLTIEEDVSYVLDFIVHNSPNGYIGFEQGGYLTNAVMKSPFSVVVFDEVEKASTKVHELLLQILEEGRLTDGKGQQVSFKDTIVIMTSNVGVGEVDAISKTIGFGDVAKITDAKKDKAIDEAIKGKFKPEFINRIDSIIKFKGLSKDDYMRIIDIELYKLNDNLKNNDTEYKGLTLKFDNKIKKLIYELGINEDFGARPLKRCIEKEVATPIAMRLLKENTDPDSLITVGVKNKKVSFKINKKPEALFVSDTHKEMATLNTALPK